jgi:hypothetical protein
VDVVVDPHLAEVISVSEGFEDRAVKVIGQVESKLDTVAEPDQIRGARKGPCGYEAWSGTHNLTESVDSLVHDFGGQPGHELLKSECRERSDLVGLDPRAPREARLVDLDGQREARPLRL